MRGNINCDTILIFCTIPLKYVQFIWQRCTHKYQLTPASAASVQLSVAPLSSFKLQGRSHNFLSSLTGGSVSSVTTSAPVTGTLGGAGGGGGTGTEVGTGVASESDSEYDDTLLLESLSSSDSGDGLLIGGSGGGGGGAAI